ncbi:MAG TPA: peptidylprolyl isomerase [Bacteroidales bacterium]|nr:peptidylprolyl isomerase [Bacteroidales bacterium]
MRFLLFIPILLFTISSVFAQYSPNDILLSIGSQKVTAGEFLQTYTKNNQTESPSGETVENYFELYTKFKLKVVAALDAKLDTLSTFKNEFHGYRNQLAKNYLTDTETLDKLIKEAYFRTATEVNASHFMVALPENAAPSDTLAAYEKIMAIRKRSLNNESFEKLAQEISEDPSAKTNKGNLGYFKALRLPYAFECAAYNTPIGQISQPVRTRFGYHLIKVNNKRTSSGEIKVAHIMIVAPANAPDSTKKEAEKRIYAIGEQLNSGKSFDTLAITLSEDRYSARNGGELPWFGAGEMVPEFEEAAFGLSHNGEISKPIKTNYGWHIIRLLDKKPVPTFESIQNDLKAKVLQSDRMAVVEKAFVSKLKKKNKWNVNRNNLAHLTSSDTLVIPSAKPLTLLTIEDKTYTSSDFAKYLAPYNKPAAKEQLKPFVEDRFNDFVDKSMIEYEDHKLEAKNPEFSQTVREYFDGLLLFEIMEREVWSKASKDSAGLKNYFASKKEKYNNPVPQKLEDIRGLVISDYQQFLEDKWIAELKKKYRVTVNTKLLNKIASKYKTNKL